MESVSRSALRLSGVMPSTRSLIRPSTLARTAASPFRQLAGRHTFTTGVFKNLPAGFMPGQGSTGSSQYFQRSPLPANTVVRFVPQQTAWVVERMGKYHKILEPGLAILLPFLDRIAYVQSLKESAQEIPSQKAITADNVTLELDGVLYTRVFDAYKAR